MFIGDNLANLRIMHGYSRKELSELLEVTEQAVWQYENSYTTPKLQIVNELKHIFQVKSKYFYVPDMLSRYKTDLQVDVMNIAYRSKEIAIISKTQSEAKHVQYLDAFVNQITTNISIPTLKIMNLRDEVIAYLNQTTDNRATQIRHVAKLARERLGLSRGTNDHLMYLIEKSGVYVFEKAIGEGVDAYSLWTRKNRAYIILGSLKKSAARRNYDLAHELGHLLLHYLVEFTSLSKKEHKQLENEANDFAGAFLLPEDEFVEDMKDIVTVTNPDAYVDLKRKWKVSLQAMVIRAERLGIIEAQDSRNFMASISRKKYRHFEPLDDMILLQKPKKIKTIFDFIAKKGMLDVRSMIEHDWKTEFSFFQKLTGIEESFYSSYVPKDDDFDINPVIHLRTL